VNEGIVLASDRRTTYNNTKTEGQTVTRTIGVHTTDSTDKTFICPNGAGISTCGEATLMGKPITGYIQDMIRTCISENCNVSTMPHLVIDYFKAFPNPPDTIFIVAGYDKEGNRNVQKLFRINVKNGAVEEFDTEHQGAVWSGETSTLTRLLTNVAVKTDTGYKDLPNEGILWNYFTLQDAVDFARYAVETTIQTMRFKNVVETVGGGVDILVITPDGTRWLNKAELV
jgi:20S proteasome alpha/beta subunit